MVKIAESTVPAPRTETESDPGAQADRTAARPSRSQRAAAGKEARAHAPLESHAEFAPDASRDPVGLLLGQARVAGAGAGAGPARADAGVAVHVLPGGGAADGGGPGRRPRRRGCGCSCAGTRTCPTSVRSPRRSGGWSSTSTTSTRRCPARSSGTSSGWPRAWPWPAGTTGSPPRTAARSSSRPSRATGRRCATFAEQPLLEVWYAHLDIEQAIGEFRSQIKAKRFKTSREDAGQGPHPRQHAGAGQAHHRGRRASAGSSATRR